MNHRMMMLVPLSLLGVSLSYAQQQTAHRPSSTAAGAGDSAKPRREMTNPLDGSTLIEIPAGSFVMGSKDGEGDEKMVHTVYLDTYYMSKFEITVGQFRKFCDATGTAMPEQPEWNTGDNYPVVKVTWYDAKAYCDWAGLRLPTEAEWEKAARGTDGREYPWGNRWDASKCNIDGAGDAHQYTAPVGSFPTGASPYGVYDMAGNVWEWCNDWFVYGYYVDSPSRNPPGPPSGDFRVSRGGSWSFPGNYCRVFCRNGIRPGDILDNDGQGFRPAK